MPGCCRWSRRALGALGLVAGATLGVAPSPQCLEQGISIPHPTSHRISSPEESQRPDPRAGAESPESLVVEDFEDEDVGGFPRDWEATGWGEIKEKPYRIAEENGNRFLRAEDTGQNVILFKRFTWDVKKYPFIAWRWRIRAVPEGADERYEKWADNAAGLYLTYRKKLGLVPQSVKLVWSSNLPPGSAFRRSGIGMPWTIVCGSGAASPNEWHSFTFDALDAYQKTFGGDPGDRALGVGILSDANNTRTKAFADYDDIVVLAEGPFPLRIRQFISAR